MTFDEIVSDICDRLNLTSSIAIARVGAATNRVYKKVTSSIGLNMTRRTEVQANADLGSQLVTFTDVEKVISVIDRSSGQNRFLDEVMVDEIDRSSVLMSDAPTKYAIYRANGTTVQIKTNAIAQTAYTLYAPGIVTVSSLASTDAPDFPESYHDILVEGVLYEEYLKQEKPQLAMMAKANYEDRLGDLRLFIAKSPQQDIYPGKRRGALSGGGSVGSSGSSVDGATSYTQTGLITFDRTGAVSGSRFPFAVTSGSEKVVNLDADRLDGLDSAAFRLAATAIAESDLSLSDVTSDNVTSSKHGFAPKAPADATRFLNGAATPAYAQVKDSDLSTSDVTTNNLSTAKHGFAPKAPNNTQQFLRGDGSFAIHASGAVNTPGVAVGATDTGVYSSGTGALDFATAGVKALGIDSTQFIDSPTQPRCVAYNNAAQSVADSTATALTFNSEDIDVGAMHSTASNTSRITVPTGGDGLYWVRGAALFALNATGSRTLGIKKNGTTFVRETALPGSSIVAIGMEVSALLSLVAGDYVELFAFQASGGALNVGSATRTDSSELAVVKLW